MKTAFISGHIDLTDEEFILYYKEYLDIAIKEEHTFVIGESDGADKMAQIYLHEHNVKNITIYHLFEAPRVNLGNYSINGGYEKHSQKDKEMTLNSDYDIVWSRRKGSGTDQNIKRREKLKKKLN
jgi:hypothetical protein